MFILSPLCSEEGHSLLRDPKVSPPPDHHHYYYFQYQYFFSSYIIPVISNIRVIFKLSMIGSATATHFLLFLCTQKRKKRTLDEKTSNDVSRSPRFARSRETNARIDSPVVVLTYEAFFNLFVLNHCTVFVALAMH